MLPLAVRLELTCKICLSFSVFASALLAVGLEQTGALAGVVGDARA